MSDWFEGARFGMFIHWGHPSQRGWELFWPLVGGMRAPPRDRGCTARGLMRRATLAALVLAMAACGDSHPTPVEQAAPVVPAAAEPEPRPLHRCFADRPTWEEAPVDDLLARASRLLDDSDDDTALACAEEAAHQEPRSIEAHETRAFALAGLRRHDDARDAMALALAIAPDDAFTLESAADLYLNRLPPSGERSAIGLEYARRARRGVKRGDKPRRAHLALLEGEALNDLGRAGEALRRLDAALVLRPDDDDARFERGVALFDLCRLDEARRELARVVAADPAHAHAHHHLGLIAERASDEATSARELAEATRLDPKAFPPPPAVSPADFDARVRAAVAALPEATRRELAEVPVETAELPLVEDLVAEQPPLAPTILGLFRGLPLGADGEAGSGPAARGSKAGAGPDRGGDGPCEVPSRAIILYRRNLLRTVADEAALDRAITRTLLHEIGHLHGEDDATLRDRGLE